MLDLDTYRLERGGVALTLEPKAFNLLALLISRPGHLFTKQEIFEALWADTAVTDHALTRVVAQLRRVLGDDVRQAVYLETVPTRGYRWIHAIETEDSVAPAGLVPVPAEQPNWISRLSMAVIGLAAALMLGWVIRNAVAEAGTPAAEIAWPVQLTTHRGLDFQPAFSPSGDAVAFVSDRSGALEVYVRSLGGNATDTPLTTDGGQNVQPAWSPDGHTIAFHSYRRGGVWTVPARGGVARQLAAAGSRPAWSPDGRQIVFQSDEHTDASPNGFGAQLGSTLWITGIDGDHPRPLTRADLPPGGHSSPAWSPNGRFVAFTVYDGGPSNGVWVVDVKSGEAWALRAGRRAYESVFARDGSAIFVAGGDSLITRLPLDAATGRLNGRPEVLPIPGVPGVRGLSVSPDGLRLAFAGLTLDSQIWRQPIHPDGSPAAPASPLTGDTSRRNSAPSVSPDGRRVAYVSTRRGEMSNIWVMNIDGGSPIQITASKTPESQPAWSRDGARVAYLSSRAGVGGLWTIDLATRREQQLMPLGPPDGQTRPPGWLGELQLSPSMSRLAFSLTTPSTGRRRIYVSGTDRLVPSAVGPASASAGYPAWSPDERYLAVEVKESGAPGSGSVQAGVIEVASGALRVLTGVRGQTWVRSWSPDGRYLAVAALRDGLWSLRAIDAASGQEREMLSPVSPRVFVRYPDWSPRGDSVVFERGEMHANIWTVALPNVGTTASSTGHTAP